MNHEADRTFPKQDQSAWNAFASSDHGRDGWSAPRLTITAQDVCLAIAFLMFVVAGFKMTGIESISGDSINEAFYQAFGVFSFGLAFVTLAYGLQDKRR